MTSAPHCAIGFVVKNSVSVGIFAKIQEPVIASRVSWRIRMVFVDSADNDLPQRVFKNVIGLQVRFLGSLAEVLGAGFFVHAESQKRNAQQCQQAQHRDDDNER